MTVAAISQNDVIVAWADAIGSGVVAIFIVYSAVEMMRAGLPDLLDRTVGEGLQVAVNRALARHFKDYDHIDRVRSRRGGDKVFIEIALRVDGKLPLGEADRRAEALKTTLSEEIHRADASLRPEIIILYAASTLRDAAPQSARTDMQLEGLKRGAVLVMTAQGRLDAVTAGDFQGRLSASIDQGESRILLDFSDLTTISSAGLRILLVAAKRLQESNGQLAVCGLKPNVASVFKVSGFDAIITTFPDEGAALARYAR
jgi:anti-anti-sigma factor